MKLKIFLSALFLFITIYVKADPPVEEGKTIFMSRCASCHNINKTVVGPALAGVHERHEMDWIVKFVQSSQSFIKSGDKDASALFAKFNNIPMPDHKDLSAEKIYSVVEYIKSQSASVATAAKSAGFRPEKKRTSLVPVSATDYWVFGLLVFCTVLLIASILLLVKVKEYQRKLATERRL